jgi:hypothetical protein
VKGRLATCPGTTTGEMREILERSGAAMRNASETAKTETNTKRHGGSGHERKTES